MKKQYYILGMLFACITNVKADSPFLADDSSIEQFRRERLDKSLNSAYTDIAKILGRVKTTEDVAAIDSLLKMDPVLQNHLLAAKASAGVGMDVIKILQARALEEGRPDVALFLLNMNQQQGNPFSSPEKVKRDVVNAAADLLCTHAKHLSHPEVDFDAVAADVFDFEDQQSSDSLKMLIDHYKICGGDENHFFNELYDVIEVGSNKDSKNVPARALVLATMLKKREIERNEQILREAEEAEARALAAQQAQARKKNSSWF